MAADTQALRGVRVYVQLSKSAQASRHSKRLLEGELQDLGATCMQRLTKTCNYVVVQQKTDEPTASDRLADEQSANDLAEKLASTGSSAVMVRPTWIEACRREGKEAGAGQHQVVVPKTDPLVQRLRRSELAAKASTGKKRAPLRAREPTSPEDYNMSQLMSSSQAINQPDGNAEFSSPPAKRRATRWGAAKRPQPEANFDTQACADILFNELPILPSGSAPPVPQNEPEPAARKTRGHKQHKAGGAAHERQGYNGTAALAAVAGQLADTCTETPPPSRKGRQGAAAMPSPQTPSLPPADKHGAAAGVAVPSNVELLPPPGEQLQQRSKQQMGTAADRRSSLPVRQPRASGQVAFKPPRLAEAASRRDTLAAAAKAAEAEYAKIAAEEAAAAAAEAAGVMDNGAARSDEEDIQEWPETDSQQLAPQQTQRGPSIRQLAAAPERPLAISTATPAGYRPSASPAIPVAATADKIAVPRIVRVPTPAEPTQTTGGTGAQQIQDAPDSAAHTSRAAASASPAAAGVAVTPPLQPLCQREAPWSASRPWDPNARDTEAEAMPAASNKPKGRKPSAKATETAQLAHGKQRSGAAAAAAGAHAQAAGKQTAAPAKPQPKPTAARSPSRKRGAAGSASQENQDPECEPGPARKRRTTGNAAAANANKASTAKAAKQPAANRVPTQMGHKTVSKTAAACAKGQPALVGAKCSQLPKATAKRGLFSTSKLDPEMKQLAQAIVKVLNEDEVPGFTWCPPGCESRITHLVLGSDCNPDSRTEKLLLAVANGAHILSTEWLTASREKGRWLPEADYTAESKFVEVAERARQAKEQGKPLKPLAQPHAVMLCVHAKPGGRKQKGSSKQKGASKDILEKLATELGAKLVGMHECDYCIVSGGGERPKGLKHDAKALRAEWLLAAAESLTAPKITLQHLIDL